MGNEAWHKSKSRVIEMRKQLVKLADMKRKGSRAETEKEDN